MQITITSSKRKDEIMKDCSMINIAKYMILGIALGSVATLAITNKCKIAEKMKSATECVCDNVSSMFKIK